jgi:predicted nucleic acid-binding protein
MSNRIFFDANLPLEIMDERDGVRLVRELIDSNRGNLYVSALTVHLVMHFGRKKASIETLRLILDDYVILPLEADDFVWAFANRRNDDLEDALQLAVAIRNGCHEFVTFDMQLYSTYKSLPQLTMTLP